MTQQISKEETTAVVIDNCEDCPLCVWVFEDGKGKQKCHHPTAHGGTFGLDYFVKYSGDGRLRTGVPHCCPLREMPMAVRLSEPYTVLRSTCHAASP